ncbi:spherulation-specific family 4 protein [Streptomyces sp. WP-1]|uniref:spherulation-specific family 4 protein n=1 Tax=Streptomyces sp. WP-1 TaxID=3041497 RepID=UPI0026481C3F|nr:spherulation-specific family 4 protein [Streptomyces sp. WP-1]WKE67651.1 spherulation-specific family 4 protein [Streptomyces sp. WP-1]
MRSRSDLDRSPGAGRRRRLCAAAVSAGMAAGALVSLPVGDASAAAGIQQRVAVPAYFNPGDGNLWAQLSSSAPGAGLAVANPQTGPGDSKDTGYANAIKAAHNAGTKVVGYVDSGYLGTKGWTAPDGGTSIDDWVDGAERNIDKWYSYYGGSGLDGIFFDDGLTACGTPSDANAYVDAYKRLRSYVKGKDAGAEVVANPGASPEECYTQAADTLVTFEGTYDDYVNHYGDDRESWEATADPSKIWHLIHTTGSQARMQNAIALSKQRNAGYVYATDDDNSHAPGQEWGNPWDTLPSYWSAEVNTVG